MQSPKFNINTFKDRSVNTSLDRENLLSIGPWPVKRSRNEGKAFSHLNEFQDTGLSFSETMAQIDEVYAVTREMEGLERKGTHSQVRQRGDCNTRIF
jgi:hypothetical protein